MPTRENWIAENIIETVWMQPLTGSQLKDCFDSIAAMLDERPEQIIHVLFDLRTAGTVPASAPLSAVNTGFMGKSNLGIISVTSDDRMAATLARIASGISRKSIVMFKTYDEALGCVHEATAIAASGQR